MCATSDLQPVCVCVCGPAIKRCKGVALLQEQVLWWME